MLAFVTIVMLSLGLTGENSGGGIDRYLSVEQIYKDTPVTKSTDTDLTQKLENAKWDLLLRTTNVRILESSNYMVQHRIEVTNLTNRAWVAIDQRDLKNLLEVNKALEKHIEAAQTERMSKFGKYLGWILLIGSNLGLLMFVAYYVRGRSLKFVPLNRAFWEEFRKIERVVAQGFAKYSDFHSRHLFNVLPHGDNSVEAIKTMVDELYLGLRALEHRLDEVKQLAFKGWFLRFGPLIDAHKMLHEKFVFDPSQIPQDKLFWPIPERVVVDSQEFLVTFTKNCNKTKLIWDKLLQRSDTIRGNNDK